MESLVIEVTAMDCDRQGKNTNNEIKKAIDNEKTKNAHLRETISHLQKKNALQKFKYNKLKQQISSLSTSLDKSVKVLSELFIDAKSALEICRIPILNSPLLRKPPKVLTKSPQVAPSTSATPLVVTELTRNMGRKRLHIEPINMQELQEMSESADDGNSRELRDASLKEGLSTILEEKTRELTIKLDRLPAEVVEQHLQKSNSLASTSASNINDFSVSELEHPTFASTPLKLESMRMLGLMPSPGRLVPDFVSVRKKGTATRSGGGNFRLLSPKKEICSPERSFEEKDAAKPAPKRKNSAASPSNDKKKKRESAESQPERGRPSRKAKPKVLKEESLKK